jgi:hypothetical protein
MRRLLSISLLAAILLPFLTPLLTTRAAAETALPACCRRDGKHHCMGAMATNPATDSRQRFQTPRETCPYQQRALAVAHHELSAIATSRSTVVIYLHQPYTPAQAECLWRISFDRSRQKRGPPARFS